MRFWIPWADIHAEAGNFGVVNDVTRAAKLKVTGSGVTWAPYKTEPHETRMQHDPRKMAETLRSRPTLTPPV
jgi:hypothetical protein